MLEPELNAYKAVNNMFSNLYAEVCAIKAEREKQGSWSFIDQLRFEGLKDIMKNVTDIGVRDIADMAFSWGLKPTIELK